MLKKIEKFLAKLLKNPKKLIQILHSLEAELDFNWFIRALKERDSDTMLFLVCCLLFVIEIVFIIGILLFLGIL